MNECEDGGAGMSVVVRMDFPKRCYDCDMADGLTCMATGGVYGRDVPKMTWIMGKPEWCPIICALPEGHGRLIDASYVIDVMQDELGNDVPITVDDCFQIECKIPTIVPADTEERMKTV